MTSIDALILRGCFLYLSARSCTIVGMRSPGHDWAACLDDLKQIERELTAAGSSR
jgi:hypothetical protein